LDGHPFSTLGADGKIDPQMLVFPRSILFMVGTCIKSALFDVGPKLLLVALFPCKHVIIPLWSALQYSVLV